MTAQWSADGPRSSLSPGSHQSCAACCLRAHDGGCSWLSPKACLHGAQLCRGRKAIQLCGAVSQLRILIGRDGSLAEGLRDQVGSCCLRARPTPAPVARGDGSAGGPSPSKDRAAAGIGSGPDKSRIPVAGQSLYLDLALHVAHEADGEQEAQEAPSPAMMP
jgi:hypothetical protein